MPGFYNRYAAEYNTMSNILDQIVQTKQQEIAELYRQYDIESLRPKGALRMIPEFYAALYEQKKAKKPFFICEFKRKSPSEGWINEHADLAAQINGYADAGASAISVLTDTPWFGGNYDDLSRAREVLHRRGHQRPLLLQKDFILDEIQIYLAHRAGADIILLIAAILTPERLQQLRKAAENLGMGVLTEVHDAAEYEAIAHLDFPVLGVNNRDLKVFRTSLNRVNVLRQQAGPRYVISESGIYDYRDFAVVQGTDGFLIGTGLMRAGAQALRDLAPKKPLFKACGCRTPDISEMTGADFVGINFSPVSKRRMTQEVLDQIQIPPHAVAVFYQNTAAEIQAVLEKYPFRRVQFYAGDVTPELVRSVRRKVLMAARIRTQEDLAALTDYSADVDMFILDGAVPGSGQLVEDSLIPDNFPWPFLLAGGIHIDNLSLIRQYRNCIGIDIASGIETEGWVDANRVQAIAARLMEI